MSFSYVCGCQWNIIVQNGSVGGFQQNMYRLWRIYFFTWSPPSDFSKIQNSQNILESYLSGFYGNGHLSAVRTCHQIFLIPSCCKSSLGEYHVMEIFIFLICRTRRTCPANFGNVRRGAVVKFNQMSGEKL